jgi:hypothetical protein
MSASGFSWIDLQPSRERAAWLWAAAALGALMAAILAAGLLAHRSAAMPLPLVIGMAAGGAVSVLAARAALAPAARASLSIDGDGILWARIGRGSTAGEASARMRPGLASDRLVTLVGPGTTLAIWRDALPPAHFRRLCAHVRWHVERADAQQASAI